MPTDGPLGAAIAWIAAVLTGTAATAIAVIAIAGLGFAMLRGHLSYRDGMRVLIGCFILFGAPAIARGLMDATSGSESARINVAAVDHPPLAPDPRRGHYDPYAGAAIPQ